MRKLASGLMAMSALTLTIFANAAIAQPPEGDRPPEERRDGERPPRERGPRDGERPRDRGPRDGERRPGGPLGFNPVLAALDADSDGEISSEEIAQAAVVLKKLDANNDGKLTREELRPMGPPEGQGFGGGPGGPGFGRGPAFGRGQGFGGGPGFGAGGPGGPGGPGGFRPEQMTARIMEADTNGDGKISKDEAPERVKQRFDTVDANSDGLLDKSEIESLTKQIMERMREGGFGRGQGRGGRPGLGKDGAQRSRPEPDTEVAESDNR
ncbi:MAG: hypothetical protein R3C19_12265 [Planctomycetaceae bacterium]